MKVNKIAKTELLNDRPRFCKLQAQDALVFQRDINVNTSFLRLIIETT